MNREGMERRVRILRERLATEELPDWERAMLQRNLDGYLKQLVIPCDLNPDGSSARGFLDEDGNVISD
jgi:hypothetical protein